MMATGLAAAFIALTGLTACDGGGNSGNGGNSGGGNAGKVTTITVGYFEGAYGDIHWKSWEKLYNEAHPNEKIELEPEGDRAYGSAVENLLMTGAGPDIMVAPMTWRKHASRGWLEPLGDVYSSDFGNGSTLEQSLNDEIKDNLKFNGEVLTFNTETAWSPCNEMFDMVCEKYPTLRYFYQSEEPGMCEYWTNDDEGKYFPDRYYVDVCTSEEEYYSEYFQDLESVYDWLEGICEVQVKSRQDVNAIVKQWKEENEDAYCSIHEYQISA